MGGKTWSKKEERFFWEQIIPQSPKAVKRPLRIADWEECAQIMQRAMGEDARRAYTKLMLCWCSCFHTCVCFADTSSRALLPERQDRPQIAFCSQICVQAPMRAWLVSKGRCLVHD